VALPGWWVTVAVMNGQQGPGGRYVEEQRVVTTLAELIDRYGIAQLQDPRRLQSLLNDQLGADAMRCRKELNLVVSAVSAQIPAALLSSTPTSFDDLVDRLATETGLAPLAARWAVQAWADLVGSMESSGRESGLAVPTVPGLAPPAPSRATQSGQSRTLRWWILGSAGALTALALVAALLWIGRPSAGVEIVLESVPVSGPDPFAPDFSIPSSTPSENAPSPLPVPPPAVPPGQALSVTTLPGGTEGLYGGISDEPSCNRDGIAAFLASNPDEGQAWVDALNADPTLRWRGGQRLAIRNLRAYVAELTPVVLRAPTRVTNHGFRDGRPAPFQSILQAGTPVLVDAYGTPRVRCKSGNPLRPRESTQAVQSFTGQAWAGFNPSDLTAVSPADQPIPEFGLIDIETGERFRRPAGTTGDRDIAQVAEEARISGRHMLHFTRTSCVGIEACEDLSSVETEPQEFLVSDCNGDVCTLTRLDGTWAEAITLTFDGRAWRGSGTIGPENRFICNGVANQSFFSIELSVVSAGIVEGVWTAESLQGSYIETAPPSRGCAAAHLSWNLST
jgi:hypothetical protein